MNHPKFYIIVRDEKTQPNRQSYDLLMASAAANSIEAVELESSKIDFTDLPRLSRGDMLYRKSTDPTSFRLETLLINETVATFYAGDNPALVQQSRAPWSSAIRLSKKGLPIIPTVFHLDLNSKDLLANDVESLGGFPVIVKTSVEAHGNGVHRFDDLESLWQEKARFEKEALEEKIVLRKYIPHQYHARLVVLGGKVVDSIEYVAPSSDFRTNHSNNPEVHPRKFPEEVEEMAVAAANELKLEFGGADIIVDENSGKAYIAEVNFPCNFSRCQLITNVDIADQMIQYLQDKSKRIAS